MLKPYLITTILILIDMKDKQEKIILTTKSLVQKLEISQQTSSRYLIELEKMGIISRGKAHTREQIIITPKGFKELSPFYLGLKKIFEPRLKELILKGEISSGLGEGAYYVSKLGYKKQFEKKLGFSPFPGTLNVKLTGSDLKNRVLLDLFEPIIIEGFSNGERSFGQVKSYRALLNKNKECWIVTAMRTHYREDILEIIAESNLRKSLELKDGEKVTVKIF